MLPLELPNDLRLRKIRNIRKVSKLHRMIAQRPAPPPPPPPPSAKTKTPPALAKKPQNIAIKSSPGRAKTTASPRYPATDCRSAGTKAPLNQGKINNPCIPLVNNTPDASQEGRGALRQGHSIGGSCTPLENQCHINVLELKTAKCAILNFNQMHPSVPSMHPQMDNIAALSNLVKMEAGGIPTIKFSQI